MRARALSAAAVALVAAALTLSSPATAAPTPTPVPTPVPKPAASPSLPPVTRVLDPRLSIGGPGLAPMDTVLVDAPAGVPTPPAVPDVAWVVADADTGDILAARNPHAPLLPASTLKALTALHLLPRLDPDTVLTASPAQTDAEGTRVGMVPGQTYTAGQLFAALVMSSGNDAAYGLAALNGGAPKTVAELNALADELGAHDTVVVDPSGLDAPGQQSSAYDLALIGRAAIANPEYVRIATTKTSAFPSRWVRGSRTRPTYAIGNHNRLVWNYPGAIGVKNGYTKAAHRTFIGAARRNGRTYIVTEMYGTGSSWRPAASLLDWAFAHGDKVRPVGRLVDRGEVPAPPVVASSREEEPSGRAGNAAKGPAEERTDVVSAMVTPTGAVTPSLLPLAGGAALVALVLVTRVRRRPQRSRRRPHRT